MKIRISRGIQAVRSLKAAQVAEILGMSEWSVTRLARLGQIDAYRPTGPDGSWRFTESSVQHFLESRERAQQDAIRRRIIRKVSPLAPSSLVVSSASTPRSSSRRFQGPSVNKPHVEGVSTNSDKEGTA